MRLALYLLGIAVNGAIVAVIWSLSGHPPWFNIAFNGGAALIYGGLIVFRRNHADRNAEARDLSAGADAYSALHSFTFTIPPVGSPSPRTSDQVVPHEEHDGSVIRGWRLFSVVYDEKGFARLAGARSHAWDGHTLEAQCIQHDPYSLAVFIGGSPKPQIPVRKKAVDHLRSGACGCGIYLMKSLPADEVVSTFVTPQQAVAECVAWGEVVEHEHGWRSQFARIERIFMSDENKYLVAQMRDRYQVPVESSRVHATALLGAAPLPQVPA